MMAVCPDYLGPPLQMLRDELRNERLMLQKNQQLRSRRLLARVRKLILPDANASEVFDDTMYDTMTSYIDQLEIDWQFLMTFLNYASFWTPTYEPKLRSFLSKVEDAGYEIATNDLKNAYENKYIARKPSKMIGVLRDSQEKIELLKPEIGEAHDHDYLLGTKFVLPSTLPEYQVWIKFVFSLEQNLKVVLGSVDVDLQGQVITFQMKLRSFSNFLLHTKGGFLSDDEVKEREHLRLWVIHEAVDAMRKPLPNHLIGALTRHAASVVIRLANRFCFYWFKKMDPNEARSTIIGFLNLQHEIDPATPEFLELNLKFLRAVNKISPEEAMDKINGYLKYLLNEEGGFGVADELNSLVQFVINQPEESSEDVGSFVAEIKAVIREASSLINTFPGVCRHPPTTEYYQQLAKIRLLKENIWLLNAEIFIKGQLNIDTIFYPSWSSNNQITSLNKGVKNLSKFSEEIPKEKTENGKQKLIFIAEVARELQSHSQSFHAKEITEKMVRRSLLVLLLKILLFKAELLLMKILNGNENSMALEKDRIEALREGLKFLVTFVTNLSEENRNHVELIFTQIEAVARRITYLYYSFLTNKITEEMINKTNLLLADLLDKLNCREVYPQVQKDKYSQD